MPKRNINYYEEKIRKLQERSNKKRRRVIIYSSSSDSEENKDGTSKIEIPTDGVQVVASLDAESLNASTAAPPEQTPSLLPEQASPAPPTQDFQELDPEILIALGETVDEKPIYGSNIHTSLAERWLPILKKGLTKEKKDEIFKNYTFPENCKLLKAPTLNPEISSAVAESIRNRDKNMQDKQDQLGLGISAVSKAMTILLQGDDKLEAVKVLSDSCRILTNLHFVETQVRLKLITPGLEKSFLSVIKDQDRDETLFGNKLSEKIKASKAIEKQSQFIKKPASLQRTTAVQPSLNLPAASSSSYRARYTGNWTGSPRYPAASRGGRGGPTLRTTYRRPTQVRHATTTSNTKQLQRANTRP